MPAIHIPPHCVGSIVAKRNALAMRFAEEVAVLNANAKQYEADILKTVSPKVKQFMENLGVFEHLFIFGRHSFTLGHHSFAPFENIAEVRKEFEELERQWADIVTVSVYGNDDRIAFHFVAIF